MICLFDQIENILKFILTNYDHNSNLYEFINNILYFSNIKYDQNIEFKIMNFRNLNFNQIKISIKNFLNYLEFEFILKILYFTLKNRFYLFSKFILTYIKTNLIYNSHLKINYKKILGEGSYSKVFKAFNYLDNKKCVLKIIDKNNVDQIVYSSLKDEYEILSSLNHHNIIKIFSSIETSFFVFTTYELMSGGDLINYLELDNTLLDEIYIKHIFKQIVDGLIYLRNNNIAHRDLKLENIVFEKNKFNNFNNSKFIFTKIKIIDFGFSQKQSLNDPPLNTYVGSLHYAAPEIFLRKPYYGLLSDIWASGVILFLLATKTFPFGSSKNQFDIIKNIIHKPFVPPKNFSTDLQNLLSDILKFEPFFRISPNEIANSKFLKYI